MLTCKSVQLPLLRAYNLQYLGFQCALCAATNVRSKTSASATKPVPSDYPTLPTSNNPVVTEPCTLLHKVTHELHIESVIKIHIPVIKNTCTNTSPSLQKHRPGAPHHCSPRGAKRACLTHLPRECTSFSYHPNPNWKPSAVEWGAEGARGCWCRVDADMAGG